jgi:hypothetical protein
LCCKPQRYDKERASMVLQTRPNFLGQIEQLKCHILMGEKGTKMGGF